MFSMKPATELLKCIPSSKLRNPPHVDLGGGVEPGTSMQMLKEPSWKECGSGGSMEVSAQVLLFHKLLIRLSNMERLSFS